MKAKPYIGIVGVRDVGEAAHAALTILRAFSETSCAHRGQIGIQVTDRTLRSEQTDNRRCPDVLDVPSIFKRALEHEREFGEYGRIMTVVHFTTKLPNDLFNSVRYLFNMGGMYEKRLVRGLQLNGGFERAPLSQLQMVRAAYPDIEIIQQIPRNEVFCNYAADDLAKELKTREECIDFALIDPSGGYGIELNVPSIVSFASAIHKNTSIAVGFAGGLTGESVHRIVGGIIDRLHTNNFSIDAEGGLRDRIGEGYGNDVYNPDKANEYFLAAAKELSE